MSVSSSTLSALSSLLGGSSNSASSASSSSAFNVDGIMSGLSTTSLINAMLGPDQAQITALQNQQQAAKNHDAAYQAIRSQVLSFQGALNNLLLSTNVNAKTTSTDTSGVVNVTASSAALNGTFNVSVGHLATASAVSTTGSVSVGVDPTKPLSSAGFAIAPTAGTITINGQQVNVDITQTLNQLVTAMSDNGTTIHTGVTASLLTDSNNQVTGIKLTPIAGNNNPIQLGSGGDTSNFLTVANLVSTGSAGAIQTSGRMSNTPTSAALSTLKFANIASGPALDASGSFTVNGVSISWTNSDSLSSIINRINSSSAGVTASYNAQTDQFSITNSNTGSQLISLADNSPTGSGLLKALGISAANQVGGQTAQYTITQNGVATTAYSNSNTVTNALPGVSLTLTKAGSTNVTVAQDTQTAAKNVQAFVDQFNSLVDLIDKDTAYDPTNKTANILTGDSGMLDLESQIRGALTGFVTGGTYATLDSIGISTGAFGAAVGTTNHLQLDQGKLTTALQTNPNAVFNVLAGTATALVNPAGGSVDGAHNWVGPLNGSPSSTAFGSYAVTVKSDGTLSSVFTPSGQAPLAATTGSLSVAGVGGTNSTVVPGVALTASTFPSSGNSLTDTIWFGQPGVLGRLSDQLNKVLATGGVFDAETQSTNSEVSDLQNQIQAATDRLNQHQQTLQAQFTAMEVALAQVQQQGGQFSAALGLPTAGSSNSSSSAA